MSKQREFLDLINGRDLSINEQARRAVAAAKALGSLLFERARPVLPVGPSEELLEERMSRLWGLGAHHIDEEGAIVSRGALWRPSVRRVELRVGALGTLVAARYDLRGDYVDTSVINEQALVENDFLSREARDPVDQMTANLLDPRSVAGMLAGRVAHPLARRAHVGEPSFGAEFAARFSGLIAPSGGAQVPGIS